ncbi:MAG: glycosyltransferase [Caldithrix sp.]|nr:glycosyltransferase [Caldithrix sp.]
MEAHPIALLMFLLGFVYFMTGMYLSSQPLPKKFAKKRDLRVAVLVAFRNEQNTLKECLDSLLQQNYACENYDVYMLDDRSTDASAEIALQYTGGSHPFQLISIVEEHHGLKGKMNAMSQALEKLDHDIILVTDADCIVPETWIQTYVDYFDKKTGMVGGLTLLSPIPGINISQSYKENLFGGIQALDWLFLQKVAALSSRAGRPISILGNNFGFRLEAYHQVGGFPAIGFTVTEDYALMRHIEQKTAWAIKHTLDINNAIFSYPVQSLSSFFWQRWRWLRGGRSMRMWGYFTALLSLMAKSLIIPAFLFTDYSLWAAGGIGLIIGIDYFLIKSELRIFHLSHLRPHFLLWQIFHISYSIVFALMSLLPFPVRWKGEKY